MSHTKLVLLIVIGVLLALIAFVPFPVATVLAQGPQQNQAGAQDPDRDRVVGGMHPRHPIDPWTPRPALQPQYAPQTRIQALSTAAWTSIGPSPLANTTPADPNFNVSGRITGVAAHPTDANTIWISTAGGGVWKTTNGGANWTPLTDNQVTLSMGGIAVSRTNPMLVLAGTGEANNSADSNCGRGILRSTDGGTSWTLITGPANVFNNNRMACSKITFDPANANIAYAAMSNFGTNGVFAGGITGVYKSTDAGVTWANVSAANGKEANLPWSDVAVDPNTTANVYGAVGWLFGTANNGGYKSPDSGGTFNLLNAANAPVGASFGRISLAISKASNGNVFYIAAEDNTSSGAITRFARSDNGGTSFSLLSPPNYVGSAGWYNQVLIVDPTSSAIVYAAGQAGAGSILRSTNSGANWTGIGSGGAPNFTSPHPDHHAADFDPNGKYLDGNDGGIYRLDDPVTPSWSDLNGNLSTIQFMGIGLHPTNPNIAIAGSQDNGTELYTGNVVWLLTDGGDGGIAKFSPTNGNRVYHQIPNGSFGTNFFRRSDNGGNTPWVTKTASIAVDVNVQNFYAPFSVDPNNGDRVLYGTNRVWETTNGGDSWTPISVVNGNGFNNGGNNVDAIGIAPADGNTVYAATGGTFASNSQIFVTTNHGGSWTEHDLPAGNGRVNDIAVETSNSQIAYVVVSRFNNNGHVFRTTNGGTSWTNISGNLANMPVWSIQLDPSTNPATIYIGAEDGVYSSTDLGANWSRFGTGLPNAQVFQIALNNTTHILAAGTHGRGAWEISTGAAPIGPLCTNFFEKFDSVVAPALPAGWAAANAQGPAPLWVTSTTTPDTAPNSAFVDDPVVNSDKDLDTPGILITSANAQVSFRNSFNLERDATNFYDGGVLEISSPNINGGAFTDITNAAVGGNFVSGGYSGVISNCCGSVLAGRNAWSGNSGGYINTVANLGPNVVGQTIKLRFRMGSDSSVGMSGWQIDGLAVTVTDCPLQSAVSSKTHGAAGTFTINLPLVALNGAVGIECRTGAAGQHQVVANFSGPVTVGSVAVTSGTGSVGSSMVAGSVCTINLTGVTNAQRLGITLSNVTVGAQTGNITIPMGILAGDTSGNGSVTGTDVSQTKLQSGQPVTGANFREDVVVTGSINGTDVGAAKLNSGTALPP
jgi:photosystem II stability/assembly factor-like uncharacterized protein